MKTTGCHMRTNEPACIGDYITSRRCEHQEKSGIKLIMEEHQRQKHQKEWPSEDYESSDGQLALVAACYAEFAILPVDERAEQEVRKDSYWPWDEEWWKPKNPLQDLVRAGALIAAEIDRLLKMEAQLTD